MKMSLQFLFVLITSGSCFLVSGWKFTNYTRSFPSLSHLTNQYFTTDLRSIAPTTSKTKFMVEIYYPIFVFRISCLKKGTSSAKIYHQTKNQQNHISQDFLIFTNKISFD